MIQIYRLKITCPSGTVTTGIMDLEKLQQVRTAYQMNHSNCTFEIIQP
jgi:hypothetical protein